MCLKQWDLIAAEVSTNHPLLIPLSLVRTPLITACFILSFFPFQNGYYFKNAASGTYLGFDGDGSEGTMICGSSKPVEWQVTQADQGYTVHLAANNSIVLDLAGGGSADGVKVSHDLLFALIRCARC